MSTIINTAGASGSTALGNVGPVTLFNTPAAVNAIFIVYVHVQNDASGVVGAPTKLIVGPNAPVRWPDGFSATGRVIWNWVQMDIV